MEIHIDQNAGFCFGVRNAIQMAEEELARTGHLYCLGQVVHNEEEEGRLMQMGLEVIDYDEYKKLNNATVLIRAHGEPPETYRIAKQNKLTLIDGTCPIVLKLQGKIKTASDDSRQENGQVIVFGKRTHPEVVGLAGQCGDELIVIENEEDIDTIDFDKPVCIFAQTTKSMAEFDQLTQNIQDRYKSLHPGAKGTFKANNSICKHVGLRNKSLKSFARENDAVVFVGGEQSSNGKQLFGICKSVNEQSWYIGSPEMLQSAWFKGAKSVGVSGATSTPQWLLKEVAKEIESIISSD